MHGRQRKMVMVCTRSFLKLTFVLFTTGHSTPTWREDSPSVLPLVGYEHAYTNDDSL